MQKSEKLQQLKIYVKKHAKNKELKTPCKEKKKAGIYTSLFFISLFSGKKNGASAPLVHQLQYRCKQCFQFQVEPLRITFQFFQEAVIFQPADNSQHLFFIFVGNGAEVVGVVLLP